MIVVAARRRWPRFAAAITLLLLLLLAVPGPGWAAAAPDAPGQPVAVPRGGAAVVAVPLPFAGTTATSLTVTAYPGGATCTIDPAAQPRTCTVTGLDNGTAYTFTATATNGSGTSTASPASEAVTPRATYGIVGEATIGGVNTEAMAIDPSGEYAYIAYAYNPGQVRKVRLSDMTVVRTLTLQSGDPRTVSIVLDPDGVHGYLGGDNSSSSDRSPIVKFRLSDMARIAVLTLESGEEDLRTSLIDPDGDHAYFSAFRGLNTTKVVKVDLSTFTRAGAVSIHQSIPGVLNWDAVASAVMDPSGTYAYFISDTDPGAVFRVRLSDFTLQGKVVLTSTSERYPPEAVITPDGSTMLVLTTGYPGRVVAIDLESFTRTGSTSYATHAPYGFAAGVLDEEGDHLYALGGDPSWSGTMPKLLRIRLSDMTVADVLTPDTFRSYVDLGLASGGREVFALSYQHPTTSRLLRVRIAEDDVGLPGAPGAATATAGVGEATVSWSAPSDLGGFGLLGYSVEQSTGGGAWASAGDGCAAAVTSTSSATTCTVTGLAKSVPVAFRVTALGTAGAGDATDGTDTVTPTGVPDAPTGVTGTPGVRSAVVSWAAPTDDGSSPITSATVTAAPGGATCTAAGTATTCTVTGLADDTAYTFTVVASNAIGAGATSAASGSVATPTVPGAPRAVAAIPGVRSAAVSWNAPLDDGRSAVTSYRATASPGGRTCTASAPATTCTVTALSDGTAYTFTVAATNGVGTGASSSASAAVSTPALPGPPTDVTAVRGDTTATVSWSDPADDGGEDLTSARATASPGGRNCTATAPATSCTVTGLTNGTAYTFAVTATTAVGTGSASTASAAVTPAGTPAAPTITGVSRGVGSLVVTFTAAAPNGEALLRYEVALDGGGWTSTAPALPDGAVTVDGLDDATAYAVTLRAVNAVGAGSASTAVTGTTAALPAAPTITGVTAGDEEVTVAWDDPDDDGGSAVTTTTVTAAPGGATCSASAPATSCTVTGLTNGATYTFTAAATNGVGEGPASDTSSAASPLGLPLAPVITEVRSGSRSLTVMFEAADGNGSTVTGYQYRLGELAWVTPDPDVTAAPLVIGGLADGAPYRVSIRAVSDVGAGAAAEPMLGRTLPAPGGALRGPVLLPGGEPPIVAPGARSATVAGRPVGVSVLAEASGGLRLEVGPTTLRLAMPPGGMSGTVPVLLAGGSVPLAGDGFAPDSIVEVWLFSEPQLLALLRVDGAGAIDGEVPLNGWATGVPIPAGAHTLQVGGMTADGELLGLSLGVDVVHGAVNVDPSASRREGAAVDPDPVVVLDAGAVDRAGSAGDGSAGGGPAGGGPAGATPEAAAAGSAVEAAVEAAEPIGATGRPLTAAAMLMMVGGLIAGMLLRRGRAAVRSGQGSRAADGEGRPEGHRP